ncbi:hypothetical protein LZ30DRAFT_654553 [Colletotrichum cereale]|nr:hypothetical protein LZ30DRAFT_654553 [Colletotrichum cereale]
MPTSTANPNAVLFGAAQHINGPTLTAIGWSNASLSFVFLLLRLLVRWRRNRSLLPDDYWIILGWLCLLALALIQIEQIGPMYYLIHLQAGRLVPSSLQELIQQVERWLRWSYAMTYIYWTGLWAVKASILTIFFHLVSPVPMLRRAWYSVAVLTLLTYLGGWVAGSLTCNHFADFFVAGKCMSPEEVARARFSVYYAAAVDIATDLLIMGLPIAMLPSLQLDIRKKLGLAVAFSLALITILIAVIRMTQVMKGDTLDMVGLSIWSITELGVAIIVGSLPPLKVLLTSGFRRYTKSKRADREASAKDRIVNGNGYCPNTTSRSIMVAESIPLDNRHRSEQLEGGIYVHKTYDIHVEREGRTESSEEDADVAKSLAVDKTTSGSSR